MQQRALLVLPILAYITAIAPFSIDMYLPAMPQIAESLSTSNATVQLTLSSYLMGVMIGPLFISPLSDALGRKPILMVCLFAYCLASVGCALADSISELLVYRVVQALTGGTTFVLSRAILSDLYEGNDLSKASSIMLLIMTIAPIVAPISGAQVLRFYEWRVIFGMLVFLGGLGMILLFFVRETLPKTKRRSMKPLSILKSYSKIFRSAEGMGYVVVSSGSAGAFFASLTASPFIFIDHFGMSPENFSYLFAIGALAAIFANGLNTKIVHRFGFNGILLGVVGLQVLLALLLLGTSLTGMGGFWGIFAVTMWLMGVLHLSNSNSLTGLMGLFRDRAGAASAVYTFIRYLTGMLCSAAVSLFNTSAPWPLALVICFCALLSVLGWVGVKIGKALPLQG